jgi:hypothetical protein
MSKIIAQLDSHSLCVETQILDAWNWVNGSGHSSTAFVDSLLFSTIYLPRGSVYIFAPSRMDRVDCG